MASAKAIRLSTHPETAQMATQPSGLDPRQREAIKVDRDAFLAAVRPIVGDRNAEAYARIIDHLIEWSVTKAGIIELRPRDGKQAIVRFCLAGTPRVFWSAYPR